MAPGEVVLGQIVERRRSHTIGSLFEATGIEWRRVGSLLVRLGHVPPDTTDAEAGRLVFPAERFEAFCTDLADAVPLHAVPDHVQASRHLVVAHYCARILQPLVPSMGTGDVRHVVFARRHLDEILARIAALPVMQTVDPDVAGSVPEASRRGAGQMTPLFARILPAEVKAARAAGRPGFACIVGGSST